MEKAVQKFDMKQREIFAAMLRSARERAEAEFKEHSQPQKDSASRDLAKSHGCLDLAERTVSLQKELHQASQSLREFGFEVDEHGRLRLWGGCSVRLDNEYAKLLESKTGRKPDLRRYDVAVLGVYAAETPADAKTIVEPLL